MSASEPLVIPARGTTRDRTATKRTIKGRQGGGGSPRARDDIHRADAVAPAVAALLAVTSIPRPKTPTTRRRRQDVAERRGHRSMKPILDEKDLPDAMPLSAALELLLSPSDSDAEIFNPSENEARAVRMPSTSSVRTNSFESVPSLDVDDASQASLGSPPSPSPGRIERRVPTLGRKERPLSSPPAQDCMSDHPLLSKQVSVEDDLQALYHDDVAGSAAVRESRPISARRSSSSGLKSNLTASLRVLRSAAKSFTNFTASSTTVSLIQADDFLTRSILSLSPQFTDERRPPAATLQDDVPTAAQRRYYNPPAGPVSTSTLEDRHPTRGASPRHLHDVTLREQDPCTAAIQLQTYHVSRSYHLPRTSSVPRASSSSSSTGSDRRSKFSAWQRPISPEIIPMVRGREPRENSDFLRVIVLEMNMRRVGKLSDTAPGKARFILPARKAGERISNDDPPLIPDIALGDGRKASSAGDDEARKTGVDICESGVAQATEKGGRNGVGRTTTRPVPRRWIGLVIQ